MRAPIVEARSANGARYRVLLSQDRFLVLVHQDQHGNWNEVDDAPDLRSFELYSSTLPDTPVLAIPTIGASKIERAPTNPQGMDIDLRVRALVVSEDVEVELRGELRVVGTAGNRRIHCVDWRFGIDQGVPQSDSFPVFSPEDLARDELDLGLKAEVRWTQAEPEVLAPRWAALVGIDASYARSNRAPDTWYYFTARFRRPAQQSLESPGGRAHSGVEPPEAMRFLAFERPLQQVAVKTSLTELRGTNRPRHSLRHELRFARARPGQIAPPAHCVFVDLRLADTDAIVEEWNRKVAGPALAALRTSKEGFELSLVPCFEELASREWSVGWLVVDAAEDLASLAARHIRLVPELDSRPRSAALFVRTPGTLQPQEGSGGTGSAELPGLLDHAGRPLRVALEELEPLGFESLGGELAEPATLALQALSQVVRQPRDVRIGALDIAFAGSSKEPSTIAARLRPAGGVCATDAPPRPELDLDLRLPVLDAKPGGQDSSEVEELPLSRGASAPLRGSPTRPERPIVIRRGTDRVEAAESPESPEPRYELHGTERTDGSQRDLGFELSDRMDEGAPPSPPHSLLIVDRAPFLVAAVEVAPLRAQLSGQTINEVANWSYRGAEGAGWEILADRVDLRLPPQAIGEQYERREHAGIDVGQRSQARLSPPARLLLDASYLRQRFVEAPWNLRRLLGYAGQRVPGARVRSLRFELLYGIQNRVDASGLLLTELFARVGNSAAELRRAELPWRASRRQREIYASFRDAWKEARNQIATRLAVLEPWLPSAPDEPLELVHGVRSRLRENADLRHPLTQQPMLDEGSIGGGLAGGWAWGFESQNVFDATLRQRDSVSAELRRPFFSALGGWGWQKSVFDEGRQAIYADAAMGRTFFYALERLGRIGVLWNRARHVIIYERTVAPSLQFTGEQQWHLGRPVVRKVREFVELLEPRRSYPENEASPHAAGMVLASSFGSTQIPVDSKWGADVDTVGWQVPLWRSGEDPRVYRKPSISLEIATAPDTGRAHLDVEIEEPDKLVFYTDTRKGTGANTDAWEAIRGVDFEDLPIPRPRDEDGGKRRHAPLPVPGPGERDFELAGTPSGEPGYDAFTWRLLPSEQGVDIVGRRASSPLSAVVENVTMQRSAGIARKPEGTPDKLVALVDQLPKRIARELDALKDDVVAHVFRRDIPGALKRVETAVAEIEGTIDEAVRGLHELCREGACQHVRTTLRTAFAQIEVESEKELIEPLESSFRRAMTSLERPGGIADSLGQLLKRAEGLEARLRGPGRGVTKEEIERELVRPGETAAAALRAELTDLHGALLEGVDAGRRMAHAAVRRAEALLDERARPLTRALGSAGSLAVALIARAEAVVADASDAAATTRAEWAWVRSQLKRRSADVASWIAMLDDLEGTADLKRNLEEAKSKLDSLARVSFGNPVEREVAEANRVLGELSAWLTHGEEQIEQLLTPSPRFEEAHDHIDEIADDALKRVDDLFREARGALDSGADALGPGLAALVDALEEVEGSVPDELREHVASVCARIQESLRVLEKIQLRDPGLEVVSRLRRRRTAMLDSASRWIEDELGALIAQVCRSHALSVRELGNRCVERLSELRATIHGLPEPDLDALVRPIQEALGTGADLGDRLVSAAVGMARQAGTSLFQKGAPDLRLLKAWGRPPRVPGLEFSVPSLSYYFHGADGLPLPHVDVSAVTGLVNRAGRELRGLGIRMPTLRMGGRLLADGLGRFSLSDVFPDFGGIRLDGLFPGLKLPAIADDRVRVTHGIDKETRRAWVQADVDVPFDEPIGILPFDPLNVSLASARFQARTRTEGDLDGDMSSRTRAELTSNWEIAFAGLTVVRLRDATLTHEHGRTRFHIDPERVELPGAMQFLTDLLASTGLADTGLTVRVLPGSPPGLESQLLLPLPDITSGAFSIYNLRLLTTLTLGFADGDFFVETRFALGDRTRPFALAIWILTGGGYVELGARYTPRRRALVAGAKIGIAAGASLAFNFGPIRGGVWFLFALEVDWKSGGGGLSIAQLVIVRGEARVFGIITVSLSLVLEGRYRRDGTLTARGDLEVTVKLGKFFKKTVRVQVEYRLAGPGGGSRKRVATSDTPSALESAHDDGPDYLAAAEHYIGMLAG